MHRFALLLTFLLPLIAQQPGKPKFEVASVKQSRQATSNWTFNFTPEGFNAENAPPEFLISWAYHVKMFQVTGGPKWIADLRYDIRAKAARAITNDERMQMLQSLLEDRFHLKLNRVQKQQSIYALVVAKGGQKLKSNECQYEKGSACGAASWGSTDMSATGIPLSDLAGMLTDAVDLPVLDMTGIKGRYDVKLHWAPEETAGTDAAGASIFTAVQEQLGLKLEPRKGPIEMLVIEQLDRPDEN